MFCYQCEQTAGGTGCTRFGVCGKSPEVAALQDLLVYSLKGLSYVVVEGKKHGVKDPSMNHFIAEAMFSTLTNVNFDPERFVPLINTAVKMRDELKKKIADAGGPVGYDEKAASITPASTMEGMIKQGAEVGVMRNPDLNPDIRSLQELLVYGLKGLAAYADHAALLGQKDDMVYDFIFEALAETLDQQRVPTIWSGLFSSVGRLTSRRWSYLTQGTPVTTVTQSRQRYL